jgi:zinc resistance-associated protein
MKGYREFMEAQRDRNSAKPSLYRYQRSTPAEEPPMRPSVIAFAAASLLATAAAAQDRNLFTDEDGGRDQFTRGDFGARDFQRDGWRRDSGWRRFSPEDIEAFTDARIAALHAGLKLNPEQEKLWPPVEQAIRDLVKMRREEFRSWRESRREGRDDLPGFLRGMAERQASRAEGLRKLAEASAPLYATFDEAQKRRLRVLVRQMRPHGMMRHAWRGGHGGMRGRHGMDD